MGIDRDYWFLLSCMDVEDKNSYLYIRKDAEDVYTWQRSIQTKGSFSCSFLSSVAEESNDMTELLFFFRH